jgi:hypothetical protein
MKEATIHERIGRGHFFRASQQRMNFMDFTSVPPGTVLFTDHLAAESLALLSSFSELVPSKFIMICDLEGLSPDDIKALLQRLIGIFEIEGITLFVAAPVSTYLAAIEAILDMGEFAILTIYTTTSDVSAMDLPQGLSRDIIKMVRHMCYDLSKRFSIVPSMLRNLPLRLTNPSALSVTLLAEHVTSLFRQLNEINPAFFAFGSLAETMLDRLDTSRSSDSKTAVLLVDRTAASTPLFCHCGSLLDEAASYDLVSTLKDRKLIEAELNVRMRERSRLTGVGPNSLREHMRNR